MFDPQYIPLMLSAKQGGPIGSHFYVLWYDPAGDRTTDLPVGYCFTPKTLLGPKIQVCRGHMWKCLVEGMHTHADPTCGNKWIMKQVDQVLLGAPVAFGKVVGLKTVGPSDQ